MYEADRITEREAFIHSQNTNTILKSKGQRRTGGINTPHAVSNCNNGNRKKKQMLCRGVYDKDYRWKEGGMT